MGDASFYKTRRNGYLAREMGTVSKRVRQESPAFAKPRKNNSEFGYGSRVGKLIRNGVRDCFPDAEEGYTNAILAGEIKKALAADTNNPHGQRRLTFENVAMLKGFNWTESVRVNNVLKHSYTLELDGNGGTAKLDIVSFTPQ